MNQRAKESAYPVAKRMLAITVALLGFTVTLELSLKAEGKIR